MLGLGAGALSLALLAVGMRQVVPESQSLLVATHGTWSAERWCAPTTLLRSKCGSGRPGAGQLRW